MIPVDLEKTQEIARTVFDGEATQEIDAWRPVGLWRIGMAGWFRAPELSERYPTIHTDMTRRQAE